MSVRAGLKFSNFPTARLTFVGSNPKTVSCGRGNISSRPIIGVKKKLENTCQRDNIVLLSDCRRHRKPIKTELGRRRPRNRRESGAHPPCVLLSHAEPSTAFSSSHVVRTVQNK